MKHSAAVFYYAAALEKVLNLMCSRQAAFFAAELTGRKIYGKMERRDDGRWNWSHIAGVLLIRT